MLLVNPTYLFVKHNIFFDIFLSKLRVCEKRTICKKISLRVPFQNLNF